VGSLENLKLLPDTISTLTSFPCGQPLRQATTVVYLDPAGRSPELRSQRYNAVKCGEPLRDVLAECFVEGKSGNSDPSIVSTVTFQYGGWNETIRGLLTVRMIRITWEVRNRGDADWASPGHQQLLQNTQHELEPNVGRQSCICM